NIAPAIFFLLLFLSSYFGCIFLMGPLLWLLAISPKLFRFAMDSLIAAWLTFASALMELFLGLKFRHYGDSIDKRDCAIIIMNHPSRLDWMYIWYLLMRFGCLSTLKIIMKHELKNLPGPGWAMQAAHYMFLHRAWDHDQPYITECVDYFNIVGCKTQILIFPEGTNFTPQTKAQSDAYAEKEGLAPLKRVLQPRTLGFVHLRQQLGDRLDAVYDLTQDFIDANSSPPPSSELKFLRGQLPAGIAWRVRRHPASLVPMDAERAADWLRKLWRDKDLSLCNNIYQSSDLASGDQSLEPTEACSPTFACRIWLIIVLIAWLVFVATSIFWLATSWLALAAFSGLNAAFAGLAAKRFGAGLDAVTRRAARRKQRGRNKDE
ncbi:hypothetical protein BOX15_Mlig033260g4, partial [Macrostomum lignano]